MKKILSLLLIAVLLLSVVLPLSAFAASVETEEPSVLSAEAPADAGEEPAALAAQTEDAAGQTDETVGADPVDAEDATGEDTEDATAEALERASVETAQLPVVGAPMRPLAAAATVTTIAATSGGAVHGEQAGGGAAFFFDVSENSSYDIMSAYYESAFRLTANPSSGYTFKGWYKGGELVSADNPVEIVASSASGTLTAQFEENTAETVDMRVWTPGHGKVFVNGSDYGTEFQGTWYEGTEVRVEAVPDPGYRLDYWWRSKAAGGGDRVATASTVVTAGTHTEAAAAFGLETASLTITAPTAGQTAATEPQITLPSGAGYSVESDSIWGPGLTWVESAEYGAAALDPATTFEAGQTCYAKVRLRDDGAGFAAAAGGSTFSTDLSVTGGEKQWQSNGAYTEEVSPGTYEVHIAIEAVIAVTVSEAASPTPTYTVSAAASPAEGGTVSGGGTFDNGASVTVTATPNNGYRFVNWTAGGAQIGTDATYTFSADEDTSLVAHFERVYRDVWIDNTVDNSVSHVTGVVHITGSGGTQAGYNPGVTIYSEDASVTFSNPRTAQVQGHIDAAYTQVYGLANTCKSNGKSGEFHMSTTESTGRVWDNRRYETLEDASEPTEVGGTWAFPRTHIASGDYGKETYYRVEANGWVSGYEITVTTEGSGTASADLAASLAGETVTLTATPDTNSRFKEWQVVSGGMTLSGDSFTMPAADVAVKAVFAPIPVYTVTIVTDGGSVSADQTVAEGGRIARPADPVKDGSVFAGWYGDAAFTAAFDFDAPITADTTVFARWTATPTPTATPTASSTASPKTGDDTAAGVWSALTLVSGLALAGLALIGRRRRTDR